jgi:hypothetical protein
LVLNNVSVGRLAEANGGDAKRLTRQLVEAPDALGWYFDTREERRVA